MADSLSVVVWEIGSRPEPIHLHIKDALLGVESKAAKNHKYCFLSTEIDCAGSCTSMKEVVVILNNLCYGCNVVGFSPLCLDNVWEAMQAELARVAMKERPPKKKLH